MKVTLVRGDERVEIDTDDSLMEESCWYRQSVTQTIREVTEKFYRSEKQEATCQK